MAERTNKEAGLLAKRAFDIALSATLLVLAVPLLLVVAIGVWLSLGRPVLFTQTRPGLSGRPFLVLKFRTMREACGSDGKPLADIERMTPFGRLLRATSLDELPELWNVLKGDMSIVGPRPLLMEYLPLYNERQKRRHEVRPGLTGWAQIHGRNNLDWKSRFDHDVWYVDHRSMWLDLKILGVTIAKVLRAEDISQQGHITAEPFRGNDP